MLSLASHCLCSVSPEPALLSGYLRVSFDWLTFPHICQTLQSLITLCSYRATFLDWTQNVPRLVCFHKWQGFLLWLLSISPCMLTNSSSVHLSVASISWLLWQLCKEQGWKGLLPTPISFLLDVYRMVIAGSYWGSHPLSTVTTLIHILT